MVVLRSLRAPLVLAGLAVLALSSCTKEKDTEDYVASPPGAVQGKPSGKFVAESSACSELFTAERKARAALGCDPPRGGCPAYIRPAGGAACFEYDKGSIADCVDHFASNERCEDFEEQPCLVSARSQCGDGEGGASGEGKGGASNEGDAFGPAGAGPAGSAGVFGE